MRGPKPPPKFCLATRRETEEIICLEQFEPSLDEGSSLYRKRSSAWEQSRQWQYSKGWTPNNNISPWNIQHLAERNPFIYNYATIVANTLEDAINEYRNQNRLDRSAD
jgi:hypothetical protein